MSLTRPLCTAGTRRDVRALDPVSGTDDHNRAAKSAAAGSITARF